jgi:hypothetical protein
MNISENLAEKHRRIRKMNTNVNVRAREEQEPRKDERPYSSSQNKLRDMQKHHSIAPEKKRLLLDSKHQSQNKIALGKQNKGEGKAL